MQRTKCTTASALSSQRMLMLELLLLPLLATTVQWPTARAAVAADLQMPMPMAVAALHHVHLRGERCKNDSALFVAELHKLTLWAVQSKHFSSIMFQKFVIRVKKTQTYTLAIMMKIIEDYYFLN
jgi:hypothetical protein